MEFNGESNQIEGGKKYNFYMDGDGKKKKSDLIIPSKELIDLSGKKFNDNKAQELGIKTDEENLRLIQETEDYNASLLTTTGLTGYKFNGNTVIVRLFKHPPVKLISGMFIPNELSLPYQDKESGRFKTMLSPLQFIYRGVINHVSDQCSEGFRNKFKVGDQVDLKLGLNLMQQRTWLNPEEYYEDKFDNYFNVNENMIEKGIV